MAAHSIAIIGTVGLPPRYGGFETLAEALVTAAEARGLSDRITVYCSGPQAGADKPLRYTGARLTYLPFRANGAQSIPYDILSILHAVWRGTDTILILGTSGALILPLIKRVSRATIMVHPDGIEWQRAKWGKRSQKLLKWFEALAVNSADHVVADNQAIADYITAEYGRTSVQISYGGDHLEAVTPAPIADLDLPASYALITARAEPENNLDMILGVYAGLPDRPLVVLSNWGSTDYGQAMRQRYGDCPNIRLLEAEYDPARLKAIRAGATLYIHGHSAGGTNPVLVEMMHSGTPAIIFDCTFNRETTEGAAPAFADPASLNTLIQNMDGDPDGIGPKLGDIAKRRYRWQDVTDAYFDLMGLT